MSTATQQKPSSALAQIKESFNSWKQEPDFRNLVPKHVDIDRLVKVAIANISKTPLLQQCSRESLWRAIGGAAELGLEPGGVLGYCYLVPYKAQGKYEAQLIVGYQGYIELGRRSGSLKQIEVHLVYENEHFVYKIHPDATMLDHQPDLRGARGEFYVGYVIARLKDGGVHVEVMTRREIDAIRDASPGFQFDTSGRSPWKLHYHEMAKKTIIRRAFKYLPKSADLARAFDIDDDADREIELNAPIRGTQKPPVKEEPEDAEVDPESGEAPLPDADSSDAERPLAPRPTPPAPATPTGPQPGSQEFGAAVLAAIEAAEDETALKRAFANQAGIPKEMADRCSRAYLAKRSALKKAAQQ